MTMNVLKRIFRKELLTSVEDDDAAHYRYLLKEGWSREDLLAQVEKTLNVTYFRMDSMPIDLSLKKLFDPLQLFERRILPVSYTNQVATFAINDLETQSLREHLFTVASKKLGKVTAVRTLFILNFELDEWLRPNGIKPFAAISASKGIGGSQWEAPAGMEMAGSRETEESADENLATKMVNSILNKGIQLSASDIHVEPTKESIQVRYRVDGMLSIRDQLTLRKTEVASLINRIKILSQMDVGTRREPQDGRISEWKWEQLEYSFRVSCVPTIHGEKIVLRIFRKDEKLPGLDDLGFHPKQIETIKASLQQPSGIILIAGATGTGKSTTMQSMVKMLDGSKLNIYTVEDPVERTIEDVNQIQVDVAVGLDFPNILSSLLRQDPNVIVIGEIRDVSTAALAVKASLTGHLVIGTIHAKNSHETFERLFNMGIEPYQLSASLIHVSSQRLLRKLCPHCKEERPVSELERNYIDKQLQYYARTSSEIYTAYYPKGCTHCSHIGYKGRTMLSEILMNTKVLREMIATECLGETLVKKSLELGFEPVIFHGIDKVRQGETSIQELIRVV